MVNIEKIEGVKIKKSTFNGKDLKGNKVEKKGVRIVEGISLEKVNKKEDDRVDFSDD